MVVAFLLIRYPKQAKGFKFFFLICFFTHKGGAGAWMSKCVEGKCLIRKVAGSKIKGEPYCFGKGEGCG